MEKIIERPDAAAIPASEQDRRYAELAKLADTLDSKWRIPLTPIRFGVDAVVGLLPGVGDAASAAVSGYLIVQAARLGVPRSTIVRMVGNVALDTVVGSIPLLGSVFDLFFKANNRNIALLRKEADGRGEAPMTNAGLKDRGR